MTKQDDLIELLRKHENHLRVLREINYPSTLPVSLDMLVAIKREEEEISRLKKELADLGVAPTTILQDSVLKEAVATLPAYNTTLENPSTTIEPPYGTMHPQSKLYIERKADKRCWQYLNQPWGTTISIQAPRQMGKSSLIQRLLYQVKQIHQYPTAFIDFERFSQQSLQDEELFLTEFCLIISDELNFPERIEEYWHSPYRSHIAKCSLYLSRYILPRIHQPLILAMDEVERLLESPWRNDFFAMLRNWHNNRAMNKQFANLTILFSNSTEPYLFIDNPNQSPFNVAETIILTDFTPIEVAKLNRRHPFPLRRREVEALIDLLDGHPFLTRLAFYLLATNTIDFETILNTAADDNGPFSSHLRRFWREILNNPKLQQSLVTIHRTNKHPEDANYYRLKGAGLIKQVGSEITLRNKLYETYFIKRLST